MLPPGQMQKQQCHALATDRAVDLVCALRDSNTDGSSAVHHRKQGLSQG